jgi:hypothetical protein
MKPLKYFIIIRAVSHAIQKRVNQKILVACTATGFLAIMSYSESFHLKLIHDEFHGSHRREWERKK